MDTLKIVIFILGFRKHLFLDFVNSTFVNLHHMYFSFCQMCGAGLLGWKGGRPGAHYHTWQSYVHRHPVQGELQHQ